jgi:phenylpropionate dioxygenase-like ring-hydroxylating dioxygenase large terminal subunit
MPAKEALPMTSRHSSSVTAVPQNRFLRNFWYVAGFPEEFGRHLLPCTFLGENVVLFRREDGTPVAFEDRCAHRRLPLSMGRLKGDTVECGYHGLIYNDQGRCIFIPGEKSVPAGARVRCFPVIERYRYWWIWLGDPVRADAALIPDYSRVADPAWGSLRIALHLECNYLLTVDNLLDLSHLPYVHGTTTGNAPVSEEASVRTERTGDCVQVKRWARNVVPAPTFAQFGGYNDRIDMWQVSEFRPPSYVRVNYGSVPTGIGIPEGDGFWTQGHWGFQVYHGLTPETERTTHQFRYVVHPPGFADDAALREFYRQCDQIICEDLTIFAIQQRALDQDREGASAWQPNARVAIDADGGLLQARAIHQKLLAEQDRLHSLASPGAS